MDNVECARVKRAKGLCGIVEEKYSAHMYEDLFINWYMRMYKVEHLCKG